MSLANTLKNVELDTNMKEYYIDKEKYYVIENYDKKTVFSSFLSGIVGEYGIPLWSFYVNRGQGICSFGLRNKDNAIMEFYPANESYKQVYTNGFRTFLKIEKDNKVYNYEPFSSKDDQDFIFRKMKIKNNELVVEDVNNELGIKTTVNYFVLPNENFASLVRKVKIENLSDSKLNIQVIDGMPALLPFGSSNSAYKEIANTLRSWMQAKVIDKGLSTYAVTSSTDDSARVEEITKAYFYISFDEDNNSLSQIINPETIFDNDTSYINARGFNKTDINDMYIDKISYNKVPCAFSAKEKTLEINESIQINSLIGYTSDKKDILSIQKKVTCKEYIETKRVEANDLIDNITNDVNTKTNYPLFDEYVKQCYIDNILRGGYPINVGDNKIYHIYSRKHGDLERDYNFFSIEDNFYSQGNGNFRDLNQNRRLDVFFKPFTKIENIKLFSDLIQLDGYNPLVIKGKKFTLKEENFKLISNLFKDQDKENVSKLLSEELSIGEILKIIRKFGKIDEYFEKDILNKVVSIMNEDYDIAYGEGFWIDHWTYNLDLIEEYLGIYPENKNELLYQQDIYRFYNAPEYVVKRDEKYVLVDNKIRQYNAIKEKDKSKLTTWVQNESGDILTTNLFNKLLMLATLKFTSLDVNGYGIEMESNKPGWNDSMNGLPGLLGSSLAETLELKRLLIFIKENIDLDRKSKFVYEFGCLLLDINDILIKNLSNEIDNFNYWNNTTALREDYRDKIKYTVNGNYKEIDMKLIDNIIENMLSKINKGIDELNNKYGSFIPTYLYYDIDKYEINEKIIKPLSFKMHVLPVFLEGAARKFKTNLQHQEKIKLYNEVKSSEIYDKKLKMYKTSDCLENESLELGRGRAFTKGWLERESIFMHMEFKYILELIKNGLYEEFYKDIKTILPPFMNPEVYGRSILENSSFIASSSNPDEKVHGKGFIARLSGTTIEFLSIWKNMMIGNNIFTFENDELVFNMNPILSEDFFDENNEISFTLLGKIYVKYSNPLRKSTFEGAKVTEIILKYNDDTTVKFEGNKVIGNFANDIRNLEVKEIYANIG